MKIVIFAPHPDDEFFGTGAALFKWLDEGQDVHIVYMTDNSAGYTFNRALGCLVECEETQISEYELAKIAKKEVEKVRKFLKLKKSNVHLLWFPDQKLSDFKEAAIMKVQEILEDADIVVIPSNHNTHVDHQATFDVVTEAIDLLNIDPEIYVYCLYSVLKKLPPGKKLKFYLEGYNDKIIEGLKLYKSQLYITYSAAKLEDLKTKKVQKLANYRIRELGSYPNF